MWGEQINLELDGSIALDLPYLKSIADKAWRVVSVVSVSLLSWVHSGVSRSRSNQLER